MVPAGPVSGNDKCMTGDRNSTLEHIKSGPGTGIAIICEDGGDREGAECLAAKLRAQVVAVPAQFPAAREKGADADVFLRFSAVGLSLEGGGQHIMGDFAKLRHRIRPNELRRELLVRAAGIRSGIDQDDDRPVVLDATAGMGEDAFLLAAAGAEVCLCESDPVIAALLRDTLRRAAKDPELAETARRMHLYEGDSIGRMERIAARKAGGAPGWGGDAGCDAPEDEAEPLPDVIYLDPMFPERTKSALVKKKFQILHMLEAPCSDEDALLSAAIAARPGRVVIKRPIKGPVLAGRKPDYSLRGKAVRYDCILTWPLN